MSSPLPPVFPPALLLATRALPAGSGAFGTVYKVLLGGHTLAAAKVLHWGGRRHQQVEFVQVWWAGGRVCLRPGACAGGLLCGKVSQVGGWDG